MKRVGEVMGSSDSPMYVYYTLLRELCSVHKRRRTIFITASLIVSIFLCLLSFKYLSSSVEENEMIKAMGIHSFSVSKVFGSNMVLPRSPEKAMLWGWCEKSDCNVVVTFNKNSYNAIFTDQGEGTTSDPKYRYRWEVLLPKTPAGGPYQIIVTDGKGEIKFKNVLFGDVYVCGGQSNMKMSLLQTSGGEKEVTQAYKQKNLRLLSFSEHSSPFEMEDVRMPELQWSVAGTKSTGSAEPFSYFSAVCWHFGKSLSETLHDQIPIGLISTAVVGSPIQPWIPSHKQPLCSHVWPGDMVDQDCCPTQLSVCYNAIIHPLRHLHIKGVVWYQGESNILQPDYYKCAFPSMVEGWRESFGIPYLPFFYVMLHPFKVMADDHFLPRFRLVQHDLIDSVKNVYMASAADLGDAHSPWDSLHPRYKQEIGRRLQMLVAHVVYQVKGVFTGPVIQEARFLTNTIEYINVRVDFFPNTVGSSLYLSNATALACPDNFEEFCGNQYEIQLTHPTTFQTMWVNASAYITSDSKSVIISLLDIYGLRATKVRYGYADWPVQNLYNGRGIPCPPFEVDVVYHIEDEI